MPDLPCIRDTSSVDGLRALVRRYPSRWPVLLNHGARRVRPHRRMTVQDALGSRLDVAALPRHSSDAGRLRLARWCASKLAQTCPGRRLLEVDWRVAVGVERQLIGEGMAPKSARKVRSHLLALRAAVASHLGLPPLAEVPATGAPTPSVPRLDLDGYSQVRQALPIALRVATDLAVSCRLRPATILALRVGAVGPRGASLTVRGRHRKHFLDVPAFLRPALNSLAAERPPGAPLWPGRSEGGTYGVAALRRRLQRAGHEVLGMQLDLRDLSDLAATVLGASSGTPHGRRVALARLAPWWRRVDSPPVATALANPSARSASTIRSAKLDATVKALDRRLDFLEDQHQLHVASCMDFEADVGRKLEHLGTALKEETGPRRELRSRRLKRLQLTVKEQGLRLNMEGGALDEARSRLRELAETVSADHVSIGKLRAAVVGMSAPLLALLADRIRETSDPDWAPQLASLLGGMTASSDLYPEFDPLLSEWVAETDYDP